MFRMFMCGFWVGVVAFGVFVIGLLIATRNHR